MPAASPHRPLPPVVVWFRDDLRVADNPALAHAAASGHPVVCVYVYDPQPRNIRPPGAAARWWLHESLRELDVSLAAMGGQLTVLRGPEQQTIEAFAVKIGAIKVCWNRRYSAAQRETDAAIKSALKERGMAVLTFNGHLLREPWTVATQDARPYQVFSAYWRAARHDYRAEEPLPAPRHIDFFPVPEDVSAQVKDLSALALQPCAPDWAGGLRATWQCGEQAAQRQLESFLARALAGYASGRDNPAMTATSRLSPYLRFGNLSVRQVWHAARSAARPRSSSSAADASVGKFLDELGWREFSYYLLYHFAPLHQVNFKRQFDAMPWCTDAGELRAWQRGETGYPLVDAGMRELWHTGWMHNRVRMVVASFLVKHLLIDWRDGEAWFWDTLVDADEASNPANWQWVAGSGADAAPYFRIFNPVLQGQKFDPDGNYVRRWVPELSRLPGESIHAPWLAQSAQLTAASVRLGHDYPQPIVAHQYARERALAALDNMRGGHAHRTTTR
ncbi:cryptochrome/photolyase family protein [Burkholderia singularis]|uniref:Deoxyribodipyrimidine photo-lyase n=1 Tax=Burkholderia singularis TaxID=1503053 RepID=A0A238H612_9BURK|nr:deoxyribodipyrimidine photo-lyase [Burkholderia singularis]SMG00756.1 Deoxyribodipyrimidine photolyase [Burkholderia singularis]